jgi:hypothetical protein
LKDSVLWTKEIFYYESDPIGLKRTVCLIVADGEENPLRGKIFARGVSICSKKDNFSKKIGRTIAKGRAKRAFFNGTYAQIKRPEISAFIPPQITHKGMASTAKSFLTLTPTEENILGRVVCDA